MTASPTQLTFNLAPRPALGAEDFLVSASNEMALRTIERWPDWSHHAVVLAGPAQSGKSHLGQVWRLASGAARIAACDIVEAHIERLQQSKALLIENLEDGIGNERVLFHMFNTSREHGHSLLLTTRRPPSEMVIALPDLRSRLLAVPLVVIVAPDETLLQAVLVKHFSDRQLVVDPSVISYIALRMERSMAMAEAIVAAVDERALASHRKVTRPLVAEVLAELDQSSIRDSAAVDRD